MSALAPIYTSSLFAGPVLKTSSATEATDRQFDPEAINAQGVARWVDRSGGIVVGYPSVTQSVRRPVPGSRNHKVTVVVALPTLETAGTSGNASGYVPGALVGYVCTARLEFTLPDRSTSAERTDLLNLVRSLLVTTITASDDAPSQATGSPVAAAVSVLETVY